MPFTFIYSLESGASMERKPVVTITSLENMKKIIFISTIITKRTRDSIQAIADSLPIPDGDEEAEMIYFEDVLRKQRALLSEQAAAPTLTELIEDPKLGLTFPFGATFAVGILVSEVILQHIQSPPINLTNTNRFMLIRVLQEIDLGTEPISELLSNVVSSLRLQVKGTKSKKEGLDIAYSIFNPVIESLILILVEYDMVDSEEGHYKLTSMGRRVLMHLIDGQRFLEDVLEGHKKFQPKILPKTSTPL
jgi:hypothetical protein